jgi:hypothetical protein
MKRYGLFGLGIFLAATFIFYGVSPAQDPTAAVSPAAGFLHIPCDDGSFRDVPYSPQPGDILLYDCMITLNHVVYNIAGTGAPTHSAIAFEAADHHTVLLELVGASLPEMKVQVVDVGPRLQSYEGKIMMRHLREPLDCRQNAALADFALAQQGKGFATFRAFLQLTPIRARFGLRRLIFGRTEFNRRRWLCSELVVAAATAAGILDRKSCPANTVYPRDLAYDELIDLSAIYDPPVEWHPAVGVEWNDK